MITKEGYRLYSPKIAKVIYIGRERCDFIPSGSSGLRDSAGLRFLAWKDRCKFVPKNSDGLVDSDGRYFGIKCETVIYDRAHRGKSWFILDLRT